MLLRKPEVYRRDPGRVLSPEEKEEAAKTVTPVDQVKVRTCKLEWTNDKWRLGRK